MKLYSLYYTWGEFDSADDMCLGIYSSEENRSLAKTRFQKLFEKEKEIDKYGRKWPFGMDFFNGCFAECESVLDEDTEF